MSIQFGRWYFDGRPTQHEHVSAAVELTKRYAGDNERVVVSGPAAMFLRSFAVTKESIGEEQPVRLSGVTLTWDGRLDNREDLARLLQLGPDISHSDARVVLEAYLKWNEACFAKLIGDWAVAVWDENERTLLLAKDFAGPRQLFYSLDARCITWSTVLDPLVLLVGRSLEVDEEYIAGYLSTYPATHLTPYTGINSVPAGSYIRVTKNSSQSIAYWTFDPSRRIRYRTERDYEEAFLQVFRQAVRRRLRSHFPVLAELSGGVDSSSIVCMADTIHANGEADTPRIDTISYFDEHEPNWNERPYFSLVENLRGREGYHIDLSGTAGAFELVEEVSFCPLPGIDKLQWRHLRRLEESLSSSKSRLLLSGFGGDEFLGGVPLPNPELQDLFARLHWIRFIHQVKKWSLQKRQPWIQLAFSVLEEFLPEAIRRLYRVPPAAPWFSQAFREAHRATLWADTRNKALAGPLPSFQWCIATLEHVKRQLNVCHLHSIASLRVSYPLLDRDLLAFLFAIPREQLVRPHQRRSLMRRALSGIVPREILERKRKSFIARQPLALIQSTFPRLEYLLNAAISDFHDRVDARVLSEALRSAKHGKIEQLLPLLGLLKVELWLQSLRGRQLLARGMPDASRVAASTDCKANVPVFE